MDEFSLIEQFFLPLSNTNGSVVLGIGDDGALMEVPPGQQQVITCDTLVEGVHFLPDIDPARLGFRALAVNISDLAAMGAQPVAFTLALTMPDFNCDWLAGFAKGLHRCAARYGLALIGGDTTRGPCSIAITALGQIPAGRGLLRSTAKIGDELWVSGTLGDAWVGLQIARQSSEEMIIDLMVDSERQHCLSAFEMPQPQVALGLALRGLASAALDLSDGLAGDVRHLCARSGVGARIDCAALPLSAPLRRLLSFEQAVTIAVTGGDDYQLLFTAAPQHRLSIEKLAKTLNCSLSPIGHIVPCDAAQCNEQRVHWQGLTPGVDAGFTGFAHF